MTAATTGPSQDVNFHKTRWLYKKDGRDVGPFRPHELKDLIARKEVTSRTTVRELTSADWRSLESVSGFRELLAAIEVELANAADDRRVSEKYVGSKERRSLPFIIVGVVVFVAIGVGGYFGWQRYQAASAQVPSGITTDLIRPLELKALPERAYLNTAGPIDWAQEKVAIREVKDPQKGPDRPKRKPVARQATTTEARAGGADDLADEGTGEAQELDLTAGSTGRDLGPGELAMVQQSAVGKLVACAQAEAERSDSFRGTTVQFALLPSGESGRVRLGKNGADSPAFASCVSGALSRIKVAPFDGTAQVIKVPLNVGR